MASAAAYGISVEIVIERREGRGRRSVRRRRIASFHDRPAGAAMRKLLAPVDNAALARRLAGLAHPRRVAILKAILSGATTHKQLTTAVSISTGPLYFHLRALEREGWITIKQRERYDATDLCRDWMLVLAAGSTRASKGSRRR